MLRLMARLVQEKVRLPNGLRKKRIYICRYGSNVSRACCLFFGLKKINPENLDAIAAACEGAEVKYSMNKVNSKCI